MTGALLATGAVAQINADPIVIYSRLVPKSVYAGTPSQLIVTIKGSNLSGLAVRFRATRGFHVTPADLSWASGEANKTLVCLADVTNDGITPGLTTGSIMTTALIPEGGQTRQIASDILEFEFHPAISICEYLSLGAIGIALGYGLRLLVLALKKARPTPSIALAEEAPEGLRLFVLQHYYTIDFAVTLLLGALALAAVMKDGRPPSNAPYWHNALLMGVGLGLLTNSDLLLRIR